MVKIYIDMVGDLFHHGHVEILKKSKALGDYLIVGVHSDDVVKSYKRKPILSMDERISVIRSCKYVDEVVDNAPLRVTNEYLNSIGADYVVHGDDMTEESKISMYGEVLDKLKIFKYTEGVSTTNILSRINSRKYVNVKGKALRNLMNKNKPGLIMEAHNGLSAKIVENTGFKGIWGSGLSISAQLGVRDANEASWTDVVKVIEFMNDATSIPILLDGDTGYGNFNNARILVRKLDQLGVAGVCLEDKIFPKTNSLLDAKQELANIDEFAGKLRACRDSKLSDDFVIVARVEALIAGAGVQEALLRANAYEKAGADAILMHSKIKTPHEIREFMQEWNKTPNRIPVVIVPTTYFTTYEEFQEMGVSLIIWANHNMRAAVHAMEKTCKQIYETTSINNLDITPVAHVFELQNEKELKSAEKIYLPQ